MFLTKPREINALLEMVPQAGPLIFNEISGMPSCWTLDPSLKTLSFPKKCPTAASR
jgi:hypothetical protein